MPCFIRAILIIPSGFGLPITLHLNGMRLSIFIGGEKDIEYGCFPFAVMLLMVRQLYPIIAHPAFLARPDDIVTSSSKGNT